MGPLLVLIVGVVAIVLYGRHVLYRSSRPLIDEQSAAPNRFLIRFWLVTLPKWLRDAWRAMSGRSGS